LGTISNDNILYVGATKDMQRTTMAITTTECNMKNNYVTDGNSSSAFQNAQDQYITKCAKNRFRICLTYSFLFPELINEFSMY